MRPIERRASRRKAFPRSYLLHEIFERTAAEFPENIAVEVPPSESDPRRQAFTYAEIEEKANQVASRIAPFANGEFIVAILLPRRSHHLYVAQLACMKAGGAYVCVDPGLPLERTSYVLEDSRPVAIITCAECRSSIPDLPVYRSKIIDIVEAERSTQGRCSPGCYANDNPNVVTPSSLCYVIYTSGTTGWPKGAMIEHHSVVNYVLSNLEYFDLGPQDRVGQCSSPAVDASVEEIWLALSAGATIVVMDDDVVQLGPDLVPWLQRERISMLCPSPTLLRMCGACDPFTELPDLRLLYVGGEALTADLADRWAPGRRLVNGYGPTECTIVASRARILSGRQITIGKAVSGNRLLVLDEQLRKIAGGGPGELCVSGECVARGYLNLPNLTAQKFVEHPIHGRIYRTGDLVQRLDSGDMLYLGRIDSQVQIRGHRVELSSVESQLCQCSGVRAAACKVQRDGNAEHLVAFIVPEDDRRPGFDDLRAELALKLPSYMHPTDYAYLTELPNTLSNGSLNRSALPDVRLKATTHRDVAPPSTKAEEIIASAFSEHVPFAGAVSIDDDFFMDLGGNSLLAARVISTLRSYELTSALAVRDLYETRTVAGLAERVNLQRDGAETTRQRPAGAGMHTVAGSAIQLLWLIGATISGAAVVYGLAFKLMPVIIVEFGLIPFVLLGPWIAFGLRLVLFPATLLIAVTCKRLLIGRYCAGRYPFLGSMYVKNWVVHRVVLTVPWGLVEDTVFKNWALRALGAEIGKRVHINKGVDLTSGGWDLLEIGDDVSIGRDVALRLVDYRDQEMVLGPISIGDDCTLETRSRMCPHSSMEPGAYLTALSALPYGTKIPAEQTWDGVPASYKGAAPSAPEIKPGSRSWSPVRQGVVHILLRFLLTPLGFLPLAGLAAVCAVYLNLNADTVLDWLFSPYSFHISTILFVLALVVVGLLASLPLQALLTRWIGRVHPGVYSRWGWTYIVACMKRSTVESVGRVLNGTLLWPAWLRWAGMRIGKKCEISSIMEAIPELTSIGDECFFADGIYLGGPRMHRGTLSCAITNLQTNTFLGNHAVIPCGSNLPEDILVGICTPADGRRIRRGTSWFGHPAFELPRREIVNVDRKLTHDPSWYRFATRLIWESLRFLLPIIPVLLLIIWFKTLLYWWNLQSTAVFFGVVVPSYAAISGLCLCVVTLAAKWILLGRVREGQHPLWSCWCGRWDLLYVMWAFYTRPILSSFEGTLFLAWYLRAMGARVGSRVVFGSTFSQLVDPDMLSFGENTTVSCMFQAHSFEDRVLKIGHVRINERCNIGSGVVLLYGADIGGGAWIGENSVVMKDETLLPGRYYSGCPTRSLRMPATNV